MNYSLKEGTRTLESVTCEWFTAGRELRRANFNYRNLFLIETSEKKQE